MKILFFPILNILIFTLTTLPTGVFATEHDQICVDKVWIENNKGKIACVTASTAASLIERGWRNYP